jgi:mRNA-degrading endonuclease RelE of RelBE toxin-antitoxin system
MTWEFVITNPAARDLRALHSTELEVIDETFEAMRIDPYSGDIKFLRGAGNTIRRRVGDWRILFELYKDRRLIVVLGVKRRGSKTY